MSSENAETKQDAGRQGQGAMVWANGALVPEAEAGVSPFDHGLLTGDGVFETLAAYGGRVFAFSRHYKRLCRSAAVLGLEAPDEAMLREACTAVVSANGLGDARVRVTVTGGKAPLGSDKGDEGQTALVAAAAAPVWAPTAKVVTVPFPRNEMGALAGTKTTSYGENVVALSYAKERGGDEAIFGNTKGNLCEGTGSNVGLVIEGKVITPPLDSGCLAGVTRGLVLELCEKLGIGAEESDLPLAALEESGEAFLTSTTREVHPIGQVNDTVIAQAPGEVTERLAAAFRDLVATDIDP